MKKSKKAILSVLCGLFCGCGAVGMAACDIQGFFNELNGYSAWDTNGFYMSIMEEQTAPTLVIDGIREMDESGNVVIPEKCDYAPGQMGITVVGIDDWAFHDENGSKIKSITLPASLTFIGNGAFEGCENLEKVYFNGTATQWSQIEFEDAEANPLYYAKEFYIGGKLVSDITIEEGTTEIKPYTFNYIQSLKTVSIPTSVKTIGTNAFFECENLYKATLPEGVNVIDELAFANTNLGEVVIPDSVTYVGGGAFSQCNLTKLTIGKGVREIMSSAFADNLTLCEVQYNATECEDFEYSNYLFNVFIEDVTEEMAVTVTVGANVKRLPSCLFTSCFTLKEILFAQGSVCTYIGEDAFGFNDIMTKVEIPDSVEYMGSQEFWDSPNLQYNEYENGYYLGNESNPYVVLVGVKDYEVTAFTIHKDAKVIQDYALSGCENLKAAVIPSAIRCIGRNAFGDCAVMNAVYYEGTQQQWEKININIVSDLTANGNKELITKVRYYYSETQPTDVNYNYWHYDENGEIVIW